VSCKEKRNRTRKAAKYTVNRAKPGSGSDARLGIPSRTDNPVLARLMREHANKSQVPKTL
jgi:hypothetical protein